LEVRVSDQPCNIEIFNPFGREKLLTLSPYKCPQHGVNEVQFLDKVMNEVVQLHFDYNKLLMCVNRSILLLKLTVDKRYRVSYYVPKFKAKRSYSLGSLFKTPL
jgi:hypothetical protein